jgi:light-regulated signal transduction histidine kinase (bacteriophytochrome)
MNVSGVNLDNCADEPIHIPGAVQSHGALFAFDAGGRLCAWSANVRQEFGFAPERNQLVDALPLPAGVLDFLAGAARAGTPLAGSPQLLEVAIEGREYDLVVHSFDGRTLAEFERREISTDEVAAFALRAHRGIDGLRRQPGLEPLLQFAVEWMRDLTGFDRVMAYRFRQDDSGDVVAEAVREDWPPYRGMRYPASDIPAQARRLYVLNTLRLIADVDSTPVPMLGSDASRPLDMSHGVLRAVSPVHVEYLRNMGVQASMSVSIVVNGRLWGLLACHHGKPRRVPYALRMACDVFAQVLAATVQLFEARGNAELSARAADVRAALMESMAVEDDLLAALHEHAGSLMDSLGANALVATQGGKVLVHGAVPQSVAEVIVAALPDNSEGSILHWHRLEDWPEASRPLLGGWVGVLGMQFDPASAGWLLALRTEQEETVRWGGRPEKTPVVGPLGHRLTPRGSFDEWREVVRDTAEPWDASRLQAAQRLLAEMYRAAIRRHAELDRLRTQLLAVLGHDLRDPLHTIKLAAQVMDRGKDPNPLGRRIQASSNRMQRLIGHVLDLSRIEGGIGMQLRRQPVDVTPLLLELVEDSRLSHPASVVSVDLPDSLVAEVDGDRFMQVAANLLSNARHHGAPGQPVELVARADGGRLRFEVRNHGAPLEPNLAAELFRPFKRNATTSTANRTGMGLGLYIANEIALAHGGALRYEYAEPAICFIAEFPIKAPG